jgi:hypothetical protein
MAAPDGAYQWTIGNVEGKPLVIRHLAADALSDLYPSLPTSPDRRVALFPDILPAGLGESPSLFRCPVRAVVVLLVRPDRGAGGKQRPAD